MFMISLEEFAKLAAECGSMQRLVNTQNTLTENADISPLQDGPVIWWSFVIIVDSRVPLFASIVFRDRKYALVLGSNGHGDHAGKVYSNGALDFRTHSMKHVASDNILYAREDALRCILALGYLVGIRNVSMTPDYWEGPGALPDIIPSGLLDRTGEGKDIVYRKKLTSDTVLAWLKHKGLKAVFSLGLILKMDALCPIDSSSNYPILSAAKLFSVRSSAGRSIKNSLGDAQSYLNQMTRPSLAPGASISRIWRVALGTSKGVIHMAIINDFGRSELSPATLIVYFNRRFDDISGANAAKLVMWSHHAYLTIERDTDLLPEADVVEPLSTPTRILSTMVALGYVFGMEVITYKDTMIHWIKRSHKALIPGTHSPFPRMGGTGSKGARQNSEQNYLAAAGFKVHPDAEGDQDAERAFHERFLKYPDLAGLRIDALYMGLRRDDEVEADHDTVDRYLQIQYHADPSEKDALLWLAKWGYPGDTIDQDSVYDEPRGVSSSMNLMSFYDMTSEAVKSLNLRTAMSTKSKITVDSKCTVALGGGNKGLIYTWSWAVVVNFSYILYLSVTRYENRYSLYVFCRAENGLMSAACKITDAGKLDISSYEHSTQGMELPPLHPMSTKARAIQFAMVLAYWFGIKEVSVRKDQLEVPPQTSTNPHISESMGFTWDSEETRPPEAVYRKGLSVKLLVELHHMLGIPLHKRQIQALENREKVVIMPLETGAIIDAADFMAGREYSFGDVLNSYSFLNRAVQAVTSPTGHDLTLRASWEFALSLREETHLHLRVVADKLVNNSFADPTTSYTVYFMFSPGSGDHDVAGTLTSRGKVDLSMYTRNRPRSLAVVESPLSTGLSTLKCIMAVASSILLNQVILCDDAVMGKCKIPAVMLRLARQYEKSPIDEDMASWLEILGFAIPAGNTSAHDAYRKFKAKITRNDYLSEMMSMFIQHERSRYVDCGPLEVFVESLGTMWADYKKIEFHRKCDRDDADSWLEEWGPQDMSVDSD